MARSQWACKPMVEHILAGCTLENRLALRVSEAYGIRIGDVLKMPSDVLFKHNGRYSFRESKTQKRRTIQLSKSLRRELHQIAGKVYVFQGRLDPYKHRTRQAVYKDIVRMAKAFRCKNITPHSMRKVYSVEAYKKSGGDMKKVQRLLNHSDEAVTMIYALADELTKAR